MPVTVSLVMKSRLCAFSNSNRFKQFLYGQNADVVSRRFTGPYFPRVQDLFAQVRHCFITDSPPALLVFILTIFRRALLHFEHFVLGLVWSLAPHHNKVASQPYPANVPIMGNPPEDAPVSLPSRFGVPTQTLKIIVGIEIQRD